MSKVELVVIGASAGGLEALTTIVKQLSPSSPAVLIAVHTGSSGTTYLPEILGRATQIPVSLARNGDPITPGRILIAPPDFHLLVSRQRRVEVTRGPRENGFRPAIDPLFRTAARAYGQRAMGVILSGALDDGSYGMRVIQDRGGVTVVQDPDEATIPSMPLSVISNMRVDHVARAQAIGKLIERPHNGKPTRETAMSPKKEVEPQDRNTVTEVDDIQKIFGPPSGLTCPDCGGALWEIAEGGVLRYRCHVGHQFSPDALESAQHDTVEGALWKAVRVLEEHAEMKERMAERAGGAGLEMVQQGFLAGAEDSHRQAQSIRELLFNRRAPEPGEAIVAKVQMQNRGARPAKSSPRSRPVRSRRVS